VLHKAAPDSTVLHKAAPDSTVLHKAAPDPTALYQAEPIPLQVKLANANLQKCSFPKAMPHHNGISSVNVWEIEQAGVTNQNNVSSLDIRQPNIQFQKKWTPSSRRQTQNPLKGLNNNWKSYPKPAFSSHHRNSPNAYNRSPSSSSDNSNGNCTPNVYKENYTETHKCSNRQSSQVLPEPQNSPEANSSRCKPPPTIQHPPPVPFRANSPNPSSIQITPINSPHPSYNPLTSPLSAIQIPQANISIPPPPLHSIPFTSSQFINKNSPPIYRPMSDIKASSPSYPPSLDSDRLRSDSNSSDKFPPSCLNGTRDRVTHQEKCPTSPMWGVVPLPLVPDTTIPPPRLPLEKSTISHLPTSSESSTLPTPSLPTIPPPSLLLGKSISPSTNLSVANSNSSPGPSFTSAIKSQRWPQPNRQRNNQRRLSQSEIRDTPSPRPVNMPQKQQNIRFFLNTGNVFKY